MSIIAHRGAWWPERTRGNTRSAVSDAVAENVALELDVCMLGDEPRVCHPGEDSGCSVAAAVKALGETMAVYWNIKDAGMDGLVQVLASPHAYFFDHELVDPNLPQRVPGANYLARASEREPLADALTHPWAVGIWLDTFAFDWVTPAVIAQVLAAGKIACVVSPELHQRPINTADWLEWYAAGAHICTDLPHLLAAILDPELPLQPVDPWWPA